jgi:hypothetical protein
MLTKAISLQQDRERFAQFALVTVINSICGRKHNSTAYCRVRYITAWFLRMVNRKLISLCKNLRKK